MYKVVQLVVNTYIYEWWQIFDDMQYTTYVIAMIGENQIIPNH